MSGATLDAYLTRRIMRPFCSVIAIAVMLLSLENLSRLMSQVQNVEQPLAVLLRFMEYLLPEYLGVGLIFALFLGIAFALRGLALSGELNVIGAIGLSPWRMLRVPLILACFCTILFIGMRGYLEPWGERQLASFGNSVRAGELGMAIKAGEFYHPSSSVSFHADYVDVRNHKYRGVMVKSDGLMIFARSAHAENGGAQGISLTLEHGQMLSERAGGPARMAEFETALINLPASSPDVRMGGGQQKAEQYTLDDLYRRAVAEGTSRPYARAALSSRLAVAGALVLLPLLAVGLAIPPQRQASAFGIGLGIAILVTYIQLAHAIERSANALAPFQALLLWVGLAFATGLAWRTHWREGPGYIEGRLSHLLLPWVQRLAGAAKGGRSFTCEMRKDSRRGVFAS